VNTTVAVCTDSFAGRFFMTHDSLFPPKTLVLLRRHSAINKMLLALTNQLQEEENDLKPLPFHNHLKKCFRMRRIH
jgi:hypothetical protein